MKQGVTLLKRRMRATRPQDFKQELSGIDQEFDRNYILNSNYQQLDSNFSAIIFSNSNYQQLDSNFSAIFFLQELSGIDQEFDRNFFLKQQLPAIGQQLVSNYF